MTYQIKRRQFIKTTALATSSALAFPNIIRSAKDKKLRIAMIGVSGRARSHFGWARKEKVTALCDVDTSLFKIKNDKKKKKFAVGRFPEAKKYQDYRELFEHPNDFDTVIISTPDHQHYPAAIRAIKAGKAVFCEKPLTWSAWEAHQLAVESEKNKIPTQMGNQGMGSKGWRVAYDYVHGGALGDLKEVHTWTPPHEKHYTPDLDRPKGKDPIPEGLDWNKWIGPAPMRPYKKKVYHPGRWRGWADFGNGGLGDWGCHLLNAMFKIFTPGYPTDIECVDNTGFNGESFPEGFSVKWRFPSNGDRPGFDAYWYDGEAKPPNPAELEKGRDIGKAGSYFVGTKGTVWVQGGHNNSAIIIPEDKRKSFGKPKMVAENSRGHTKEFVEAAKGQRPFNSPLSNFKYGGQMTAVIMLGVIAMKLGKGAKLKFDEKAFKFINNDKANALLTRKPRKGWYI